MANGLRDDQIRFILSMDAKGVQSELTGISSKTQELQQENKKLAADLKETEKWLREAEKDMLRLEKAGDTTSIAYQRASASFTQLATDAQHLRSQIAANNNTIEENNRIANEMVRTLRIEDMTMAQLRQRASELEKQLNNTSKATSPEAYNQLEKELNEVRHRMGELNGGAKESQNIFAQFTSGVNKYWAAIVAGYGSVKGVFDSFKDLMLSNIGTGREFQSVMDGLNDAWDYAKTALANMDFTNLIQNLRDAYDAGRDASLMLAELFERNNAFALTSLPIKAEMEELKTQLRNVNLTNEERIRIADELLKKNKELADLQKDIINQEIDALEKKMDGQSKLSQAEKEYVIFNYNANIESIRNANEIIALENKRAQFKDANTLNQIRMNAQIVEDINKQIAQLKQVEIISKETGEKMMVYSEQAYNAMKKYNMLGEESIQAYVNAQKKWMGVDIATNREDRRTETMKNQIIKKSGTSSSTDKELQRQRKELNELNTKIETAHQEKLAEIKRKYADKEIKTEAEFNQKKFAQEQAYYILREATLKEFKEKNKKVVTDVDKQIAEIRNKSLDQQIEYQKKLEKIILDANPLEKEKREYEERLHELGLFNKNKQELQMEIIAAETEAEKEALQQKYDALVLLEKQHQDNLVQIRKDIKAKEKAASEEDFQESFAAEKARLQQKLDAYEQKVAFENGMGMLSPQAAFDAEVELQRKRIDLIKQEVEARRKAGADISRQLKNQQKEELALTKIYVKEYQRRTKQFAQYGEQMGNTLGNAISNQENLLKAFAGTAIDILFDVLSQIITAEIAKVTGVAIGAIAQMTAKEIASKGFAGIASAAILTGVITAAMATAKSALKGLLGGKKNDTKSTTEQSGERVYSGSGYADGGYHPDGGYTGPGGKYDVKGYFADGEPFHAGEYIIPQEKLKIPIVANWVRQIDVMGKPNTRHPLPDGFADGGYHNGNMTSGQAQPDDQEMKSLLAELASVIRKLMKDGVFVNYQEIKMAEDKMNRLESGAKKRG